MAFLRSAPDSRNMARVTIFPSRCEGDGSCRKDYLGESATMKEDTWRKKRQCSVRKEVNSRQKRSLKGPTVTAEGTGRAGADQR